MPVAPGLLVARADAEPGLQRDDRRAPIDRGDQAEAVARGGSAAPCTPRPAEPRPRAATDIRHTIVDTHARRERWALDREARLDRERRDASAQLAQRRLGRGTARAGARMPTGPASRATSARATHAAIARGRAIEIVAAHDDLRRREAAPRLRDDRERACARSRRRAARTARAARAARFGTSGSARASSRSARRGRRAARRRHERLRRGCAATWRGTVITSPPAIRRPRRARRRARARR